MSLDAKQNTAESGRMIVETCVRRRISTIPFNIQHQVMFLTAGKLGPQHALYQLCEPIF